MANIYFDLTREFNADGPVAALASGQAVVYYRIAIMSKDGDWVILETPAACQRVLDVLRLHEARYRPSAPLDVRWLAGGWSSHFEFTDDRGRRVRCDFLSRPPRVAADAVAALFAPRRTGDADEGTLLVVDLDSLLRMKQTQRAKDYAVIAELARLLPPDQEIAFTTDPDTVLALAARVAVSPQRHTVRAAADRRDRAAVVVAIAAETDSLQQRDRRRVACYLAAAERYLEEYRRARLTDLPLAEAHEAACALAERWLPLVPPGLESPHADAQRG